MRCKYIFNLFIAILLIGIVSASFNFSESGSSIKTKYGTSDYLEANLNISFFNESLNSTFNDSLGNSIQLGALLKGADGYKYIFYDTSNKTISSAFQILTFTGVGFQMPSVDGNITYYMNLSDKKIFQRIIEINKFESAIEAAIKEKYLKLNKTKEEIKKQDILIQSSLNNFLNMSETENMLKEIELKYKDAKTSEEYQKVLNNLSKLDIPSSISKEISVNSISFYPQKENINLEVLSEIGGGSRTGSNKYLDLILLWNTEKLLTTITFREFSIKYSGNKSYDLKIFLFEFDKSNMEKDAYFIMDNIGNIEFEELNNQVGESNGYLYFNLNEVSDRVIFSTTANVDFVNVPVFISPSINDLNSMNEGPFEEIKDIPKVALLVVIISILLMIGIVAYILIQMWYRRRYETYLFKTRNNLYNIMIYIQNAKRKGISNEEIAKNLKKAGWRGEQINYALRKYENKKIIGIIHRPLNMGEEESKKKAQKKK